MLLRNISGKIFLLLLGMVAGGVIYHFFLRTEAPRPFVDTQRPTDIFIENFYDCFDSIRNLDTTAFLLPNGIQDSIKTDTSVLVSQKHENNVEGGLSPTGPKGVKPVKGNPGVKPKPESKTNPKAAQKRVANNPVGLAKKITSHNEDYYIYMVDLNKVKLKGYSAGRTIKQLENQLKEQGQELLFATNGGIFDKSYKPAGLYIEDGKTLYPLNKKTDLEGNFYLQPNGIFLVNAQNEPMVIRTQSYQGIPQPKFATQSGPMLVVDYKINNKFTKNSANKNIRSGVGITKDKKVIFVISANPVCFYDFAAFFLEMGCRNALYLDGAISEMSIPELNLSAEDNIFATIIAITKK